MAQNCEQQWRGDVKGSTARQNTGVYESKQSVTHFCYRQDKQEAVIDLQNLQ